MNRGYDLKLDQTTSFPILHNSLFTAKLHAAEFELLRACLNKSAHTVAQYTQLF
jgi:hypothetical protein